MNSEERNPVAWEDLLEDLSLGVIAGPDDLMGMGECLNLLDAMEKSAGAPEHFKEGLDRLKLLFNRLILEDSKDPQSDWVTIQKLVSALGSGDAVEEAAAPPDFSRPGPSDAGEAPSVAAAEDLSGFPQHQGALVEVQDLDLLRDFLEEAKEHLSSIELNMLALETNPSDEEAINAVFRPFHSIKGVAGFLNLTDVHHLSHEVENLLDAARSGSLQVTDAVIDIVLSAVDVLKGLIVELEGGLSQGRVMVQTSSPAVVAFLGRIKNFHEGAPSAEPAPSVKKIGEILVERGVVGEEVVNEVLERSRGKGGKLGEELVSEGLVAARDISGALREQRHAKENAASVRIDTKKLDSLVDMVGELVIAQSMVLQNEEVLRVKDQKLQKDSVQLRRITAELQRISMSMRMVPIKGTFQKMIRLVRDLARKSGKEVSLEMQGEETEIDRNMVEEIYDPLVHMIRNAVDHGLETPEDRRKAGKPPQGSIWLKAEQKGGNISIEITDDGRGLNSERIRVKAIERGIISPDDQLEERAIYDLIFHAGFSTNDTVTEVSGRGVGMDVVKKSLERLRGKIEITSSPGKGSRFEIKLPLTMAIIDGMIIRIGSERYVVPTIALKESLRPAKEAYLTVQGKGEMINVRSTLMPLVRLHEIMGVEAACKDPWEGLLLVVNEDNRFYCLQADEILGRQEVVIKSLGEALRHLVGVSGGAILGDGKVALIIDVKGVVSLYEESAK